LRKRFLYVFIIWLGTWCCSHAQESSCRPTVVGHLDIVPLTSRLFNNSRALRVWVPPGYDDAANATKKYKVIYLLDGQDLFDACTTEDHVEMRADETLTRLIATGKIEPIIAVGIDGGSQIDRDGVATDGGAQRAREYLPYPDPNIPAVRDIQGEKFGAFMQTEVMPLVESRYRALTGPRSTSTWGASYGGVAALNALIQRPDLFGSADIESPAIEAGNGQILRDTESLVEGPSRVALGVGTEELGSTFAGAAEINAALVREVQLLANHLRSIEISPPQVQLTVREGAKHSAKDFGDRFESALLFLYSSTK
jgi:predicted alpha/beta superfamily hydrolase